VATAGLEPDGEAPTVADGLHEQAIERLTRHADPAGRLTPLLRQRLKASRKLTAAGTPGR